MHIPLSIIWHGYKVLSCPIIARYSAFTLDQKSHPRILHFLHGRDQGVKILSTGFIQEIAIDEQGFSRVDISLESLQHTTIQNGNCLTAFDLTLERLIGTCSLGKLQGTPCLLFRSRTTLEVVRTWKLRSTEISCFVELVSTWEVPLLYLRP